MTSCTLKSIRCSAIRRLFTKTVFANSVHPIPMFFGTCYQNGSCYCDIFVQEGKPNSFCFHIRIHIFFFHHISSKHLIIGDTTFATCTKSKPLITYVTSKKYTRNRIYSRQPFFVDDIRRFLFISWFTDPPTQIFAF